MIQTIAVVGLGLIGGSFSLALKKHRKDLEIIGFDFPDVLDKAAERKAVDRFTSSIQEAVQAADLVLIAVPISKILFFLSEMAPYLKKGAIVMDVGSVKRSIVTHAKDVLPPDVTFIGGHPMAGSERSGIHHADPYLFENATYALCPPESIDRATFLEQFAPVIELIETIGARIIVLDAEKHDRIAATVSHLPQLLATTLMNYVGRIHEEDHSYLQLAAGGFRDMTRIASSNFEMWRDIFIANEGPILDVLAGFAADLQKLRNRFIEGDPDSLRADFQSARSWRNLIPKNTKGFLHPLSDVYVYAEDKPGFLYRLTQILHAAHINIKDIELLKIREGLEGVFRIGFETQHVAEQAITVLKKADYEAVQL